MTRDAQGLTVREAAARLAMDRRKLADWIRRGRVPAWPDPHDRRVVRVSPRGLAVALLLLETARRQGSIGVVTADPPEGSLTW